MTATRTVLTAITALAITGSALLTADAIKPEYPTTRVQESVVSCGYVPTFQVRRMAGDTPATVQLWRAGGAVLDEVPLDVKEEVTVLFDPTPLSHEVRQYRLRLVPEGRVSREIAALVVDGRVCP